MRVFSVLYFHSVEITHSVHSVENRKFLSQAFFAKIVEKFREINGVKELLSKMVLEMPQFRIFRANLRKFDLFGLIEKGLDY